MSSPREAKIMEGHSWKEPKHLVGVAILSTLCLFLVVLEFSGSLVP